VQKYAVNRIGNPERLHVTIEAPAEGEERLLTPVAEAS
jgi:hypothetical protein